MSVEQIRHRLRAEVEKMRPQDIREGFDDRMEQILQISGAICQIRFGLRATQTLL